MDESPESQEPLDLLTEEFLDRRRRGEALDVEAFAEEHPAHAGEIRALFPALVRLEDARPVETPRARERVGRWRVVRELGRGGMGIVHLVEDEATGERAALKTLAARGPDDLARFRREAAAVARLSHRGVCRVVEISPDAETPWIAFEYLEGETMADALRRERRERDEGRARTIATDRWLAVGAEVALALHAAHEAGLVHRDVKPSNILLAADRAVVLDFGLAHEDVSSEETRLTRTGVPVGTPAYMSPEQVRAGTAPLDRRTDVYSLGATLYEALTLEPPFPGPTVAAVFSQILTTDPAPARRLAPRLTRDLEVVLATAMEKRPERRYATARLFAEDLERVRLGRRVRARPPGTLRRLGTWALHRPRSAAAVGALGVALVTGLVVALTFLTQVSAARDREASAARRARARALASASVEVRPTDGVLSLLLAREAVAAYRGPETLTQLHAALTGSLERVRLEGHGGTVPSIAWDAAGKTLATGSGDGHARLFRPDGTLLRVVPEGAPAGPGFVAVALSPSGSRLVTRDGEGAVRLWRSDGREVRRLTDVGATSHALFVGEDAVVVGRDGRVAIVDPEGAPRATWRVPLDAEASTDAVRAAQSASDPRRLLLLTRDRRLMAYDAEGAEVARREEALRSPNASLIDGGRLAFVERRGAVGGDPALDTLRVVELDGRAGGSLRGSFGPDTLLCGGDSWWCVWTQAAGASLVDSRGVHVLDMQRGETPGAVTGSADGSRLFTQRAQTSLHDFGTYATDAMRLWVPPLGTPIAALTAAGDHVEAAEFSPDGRLVVLGRHAGGLATVHATTPVELATEVPRWLRSAGYRYAPALTADGRHIVVFADERTLRVLRDDDTERARFVVAPAGKASRWVSFHPRREMVLVTGEDGGAVGYDLDGKERVRMAPAASIDRASWTGADGGFVSAGAAHVRFHSPDGRVTAEVAGRLAGYDPNAGSGDDVPIETESGAVVVYGPTGAAQRTLVGAEGGWDAWYQGSSAGPSVWVGGLRPASGAARGLLGTCRYFDSAGRSLWEVPIGGVGTRQAVISADGERVAIPASGGLDLRDGAGRSVAALRIEGGLACSGFDGTGRLLVASSARGTVRVWDRDGRFRYDLPDAAGPCYVGFSADGRRVATITSGAARLFTTDADELLDLAARRSPRGLTDVERARFAEILGRAP